MAKWKSLRLASGDIWKPAKKNDTLTGKLIKVSDNVGQFNSKIYVLKVGQKEMSFWGTAVLDRQLQDVKIGTEIRLTYLGERRTKSGKNTFHDYDVSVKE